MFLYHVCVANFYFVDLTFEKGHFVWLENIYACQHSVIVMIHHIKDQLKKKRLAFAYPQQKSGSLANTEPPLLRKICKMTNSFSKKLPLCLATSNDHNSGWQSSFKHQNNQQNLVFKIIYIYVSYKIPKQELVLVSWEWVIYIWFLSPKWRVDSPFLFPLLPCHFSEVLTCFFLPKKSATFS